MTLFSIIFALIAERLGARSEHWQARFYAKWYQTHFGKWVTDKGLLNAKWGMVVWLLLPALAVWGFYSLFDFVLWQLIVNVLGIIVCFGCATMRAHYKGYLNALTRNDSEAASLYALQMGQKYTEEHQFGETFGQTLAWVNFRFYCAVIFWFVLLGLPAAVFYAFVRSYADEIRDNAQSPLQHHAKWLQQILFWLDWPAARVASFGYLVIGNFTKGTRYWLQYILNFSISNRKVITHTALAAEQIEQKHFGGTIEAKGMVRLVKRNVLFYLALIALMTLFGGLS